MKRLVLASILGLLALDSSAWECTELVYKNPYDRDECIANVKACDDALAVDRERHAQGLPRLVPKPVAAAPTVVLWYYTCKVQGGMYVLIAENDKDASKKVKGEAKCEQQTQANGLLILAD